MLYAFSGRRCPSMVRNSSTSASCRITCGFDQLVSISSCFLQACGRFRLLSWQYAFNLSTLPYTTSSRNFSSGEPMNAPKLACASVSFAVISFVPTVVAATWLCGKLALHIAPTVATRAQASYRCFANQNGIYVYCAIIMTSLWKGVLQYYNCTVDHVWYTPIHFCRITIRAVFFGSITVFVQAICECSCEQEVVSWWSNSLMCILMLYHMCESVHMLVAS